MIRHLLNKTVTVHRAFYVTDAVGGRTQTFAPVGAVRAMVAQPSSQELLVAAQLGAVLTHVVYVPKSSNVERGDELDAGGPRRLRVMNVVESSRRAYLRLDCRVVQSE